MTRILGYTYLTALDVILEEMRRDPTIFMLGPTLIKDLRQEFGEHRIVSTGISETAACGAGIGAALAGA